MCLVEVEKAPRRCPPAPPRYQRHGRAHLLREGSRRSAVGDGIPADQSPAGLPDLRSGRRASCRIWQWLRRLFLALPGRERGVPQDLGPLVSAEEMSRCIHCTRCVRFGQEIAGVMELGMLGRGEHSEITSFVGRSIESELSGNMIDICPVGALTSSPSATARAPGSWPAAARSARTTAWAPTWSSRSRATASCAWCRSRTKPSTNAGSATATASRMKA